jgi:ferredoxin
MSKTLKPTQQDKCNGCELCVLEAQRQLKKVGLEESLIRIFRNKKDGDHKLELCVEIDPRISMLHMEKIADICPKDVLEVINEEDEDETKK